MVMERQIELTPDRACGGAQPGDPHPPPAARGELVGRCLPQQQQRGLAHRKGLSRLSLSLGQVQAGARIK